MRPVVAFSKTCKRECSYVEQARSTIFVASCSFWAHLYGEQLVRRIVNGHWVRRLAWPRRAIALVGLAFCRIHYTRGKVFDVHWLSRRSYTYPSIVRIVLAEHTICKQNQPDYSVRIHVMALELARFEKLMEAVCFRLDWNRNKRQTRIAEQGQYITPNRFGMLVSSSLRLVVEVL